MALPSDLSIYGDLTGDNYSKFVDDWAAMAEHKVLLGAESREDLFIQALKKPTAGSSDKALIELASAEYPDIKAFYSKKITSSLCTKYEKSLDIINNPGDHKKSEIKDATEFVNTYKNAYELYMRGKEQDAKYLGGWKLYQDEFKKDKLEAKNQASKFTDENGEDVNKAIDGSTGIDLPTTELDANKEALDKANSISTERNNLTPELQAILEKATAATFHAAWDPRLKRLDQFLMGSEDESVSIRVPFASSTIATAFSDKVYKIEKNAAMKMLEKSKMESYDFGNMGINTGSSNAKSESSASGKSSNNNNKDAQVIASLKDSDKVVLSKTIDFRIDPNNYGAQAIMNLYSLTKLVGGLSGITNVSALNYMYDIRDRRRYYDMSVDALANDPHTVSNPSVTNIIAWSNKDKWGRTPYSFQDFVFNKFFGIIPNNRMITFRRYSGPCLDNLCFDSMYGDIETTGKKTDGTNSTESKVNAKNENGQGQFSPLCTVVSYFGGESGNTLDSFMSFTTGINWQDLESKIHEVSGNDGVDPQAQIDSMFSSGGFGTAEYSPISKMLGSLSTVSSKIMSFGKFGLAMNGKFGLSEALTQKMYNAMEDPYGSGLPFENRIQGPLNRIATTKARKEGILFSLQFTLKVFYESKAIGGINPKAALLDCLGNAMQMVSPDAVWWGGGHRFQILPHTYPYHDGGWRDSFMQKIYQGKFLGPDGAIAMVGSGIKKFATGDDGKFSAEKLTLTASGALGGIMGAISAGLSALASSVSIGGLGDMLSNAASFVSGAGEKAGGKEAVEAGKSKFANMASNISNMWHDKCLQLTTFPAMKGMGALLVGEPVGEWHLTIGNPLNPIMVVGNLICEKMDVHWNEELGPDDFPTGFNVTYTILHGMPRDKAGIQSMFNRGGGKFYVLPDYIQMSSDMETHVDIHTGGTGDRSGKLSYMLPAAIKKQAKDLNYNGEHKVTDMGKGVDMKNTGNPSTTIITKFTPGATNANMTLSDIKGHAFLNSRNMATFKSLAMGRKRG